MAINLQRREPASCIDPGDGSYIHSIAQYAWTSIGLSDIVKRGCLEPEAKLRTGRLQPNRDGNGQWAGCSSCRSLDQSLLAAGAEEMLPQAKTPATQMPGAALHFDVRRQVARLVPVYRSVLHRAAPHWSNLILTRRCTEQPQIRCLDGHWMISCWALASSHTILM